MFLKDIPAFYFEPNLMKINYVLKLTKMRRTQATD